MIVPGDIAFKNTDDVWVQASKISDGYLFLNWTLEFPVDVLEYESEVVMVDDGITMSGDGGLRCGGVV